MQYSNHLSERFTTLFTRNILLASEDASPIGSSDTIEYDSSVAPILQQGRERIVMMMGRATSVLGILLFGLYQVSSLPKYPLVTMMYALILSSLLFLSFKQNIPFSVRFWGFGAMMYLVGIGDILAYGIWVFGPLLLFVLVIYALTLVGTRIGLVMIALSTLTILTFGIIMTFGIYTPPLSPFDANDLSIENSLVWAFNFGFATSFAMVIINALNNFVRRAWQRERQAVISLNQKAQQLDRSLKREQRLAMALQQSLDNERSLTQLRTQIVNTISHEFRTPLTTIGSSNALLKNFADRMSAEKQATLFQRVEDSVNRLTLFMGDVTKVMRADEIGKSSQIVTVSFAALGEQIEAAFATKSQSEKLQIEYDPTEVTNFSTDPALITQVCQILVDNARKFESTQISVQLLRHKRHVKLLVKDNGMGIPKGEERVIFDLLARGSNSEFVSGLGIGLFLAKNIVELLNGTIEAFSSELETVFTVTLPMTKSGMIPASIALEK